MAKVEEEKKVLQQLAKCGGLVSFWHDVAWADFLGCADSSADKKEEEVLSETHFSVQISYFLHMAMLRKLLVAALLVCAVAVRQQSI